jgi:hypothetical protein
MPEGAGMTFDKVCNLETYKDCFFEKDIKKISYISSHKYIDIYLAKEFLDDFDKKRKVGSQVFSLEIF